MRTYPGMPKSSDPTWPAFSEMAAWGVSPVAPFELSPPTERSPIERLLDTLEMHMAGEAESIEEYRQLAEQTTDPVVAFLMRMVLDDEARHHDLLRRIVAGLNHAIYGAASAPPLPAPAPRPNAADADAIEATRAFIREEREGVRELGRLARQWRRLDDGLDSLLLEMMALDSEKHRRVLEFILHRLEAAERESR